MLTTAETDIKGLPFKQEGFLTDVGSNCQRKQWWPGF